MIVIALDPLLWSMRLVLYQRTARASETANKYGTFLSFFIILARWRHPHPVASHEALNPLYWSMLVVSHQHIILSVKTGWTKVSLFVVNESGIDLNVAN
jgi:hypothetical protein